MKAFSPVHLFAMLTTKFEEYYVNKLTCAANGQSSQILLQKLRKLTRSDKSIYDSDTKKVIIEKPLPVIYSFDYFNRIRVHFR